MTRIACVSLPLFPLAARLRSEPELSREALAVVEGNGNAARVVAGNRLARGAGVKPGLTLPQARALCPKLVARSRDEECERAAQEALLEVAERFSPRVEDAGEGTAYLDVDGRILEVNDAGCALLGLPRDDLVGRDVTSLVDPADRERVRHGLGELRDGLVEARDGAGRLRTDVAEPADAAIREAWDALDSFTIGAADPQYERAARATGEAYGRITGENPLTGRPVQPGYDGLAARLEGNREVGSAINELQADPIAAAHFFGKLMKYVGVDNVVWGTDCVIYGSPQPYIEWFRALTIPEDMQRQFGYPPLDATNKAKIFGLNAAALYGGFGLAHGR